MKGKQLQARLDGIVHAETQRRERAFDLTVAQVQEVTAPGRLDFGGGEQAAAPAEPVPTEKRDPDDDYGWWDLDEGVYRITYNERLTLEDARVVLQPRTALVEQGLSHPTMVLEDSLPRVPLTVPPSGARLKENARVSTLLRP